MSQQHCHFDASRSLTALEQDVSVDQAKAMAKGVLDFINQQRTKKNPPAQSAPATKH